MSATKIETFEKFIEEVLSLGRSDSIMVAYNEDGSLKVNEIYAEDIIDLMLNARHDDYRIECAEGWLDNVTKEQKDELTQMIRLTVKWWLAGNKLNPTWQVIGKDWAVTAGQIRAKAKEMQK